MGAIPYKEVYFSKTKIFIQNKKFEYYSSPILNRYEFPHAYFTNSSSEKSLQLLGNYFNENSVNCVSNQIHSNVIVFGSHSQEESKTDADGLFSNKCNQNLWIYTADCMPILPKNHLEKIAMGPISLFQHSTMLPSIRQEL